MDEIPDFLRRTQPKEPAITSQQGPDFARQAANPHVAPAAPTKPRQPKNTVYIARLVVKVPIDMANAESLGNAIKAVAGMGAALPEGSTIDHTAKPTFGKA